jgi:hypothetical protein
MTTPSRTVRLFISSTFRDFGEERDLLVRTLGCTGRAAAVGIADTDRSDG